MASSRGKRELTPKQLEQQSLNELYKRELDNLRKRIKTAEKAGWIFDTVIPRKPNTISPASIEKIKNIRGKSLYNKGMFQIPDTDVVLKPKKGMEYQKQASKLKEQQTKLEKYPERFKPETKEKIKAKAFELDKITGRGVTILPPPSPVHIKTTDDLIIDGDYVIDKNTGEVVFTLPYFYQVNNDGTITYPDKELIFDPEQYGYQNTGKYADINLPQHGKSEGGNFYEEEPEDEYKDEDEIAPPTGWHDDIEWDDITDDNPIVPTDHILEEVERRIEEFDPETEADEAYYGRSKSANRRRNNAAERYGDNKNTAQGILDDAIRRDGRDKVAQRLEDNAAEALEAVDAVLYAYSDDLIPAITEFAAIVKGRALSPEEAMDLQPDTDGSLSSFYPNPHRKPKNNAGDRR